MHGFVVALLSLAWAPPAEAAVEAPRQPATGMWVGLRGGPAKLRTALAAALQTQATIRGVIDRVAPDVASLLACAWNDVECFVGLGEHHDSRVLLVGDLAQQGERYTLRVARINVDLGRVIAEYRMEVDPRLAAVDIANLAIVGLTGEVVATPRAIATPNDTPAPSRSKRRARGRVSPRAPR